MQIEDANIMELDWAMAHMEASKTKGKEKSSESFLDLDVRVTKEDVGIFCCSTNPYSLLCRATFVAWAPSYSMTLMVGFHVPCESPTLDALKIVSSTSATEDAVQKTLNAIGAYSHINDLQLLPTGVEAARYSTAIKVCVFSRTYLVAKVDPKEAS